MVPIKRALAAFALAGVVSLAAVPALASNVGSIRGRVTDSTTGAPLAGAQVTVTSPSQQAEATTDNSGSFAFISLAPDAYTVAVEKKGYDPVSQPGTIVFADQSSNVTIALVPTLKTIARVTSRSAGSLVRSGTTSDVYSVSGAQASATTNLAGAGSLNQAYGMIASAPGVNVPSNQQGWYQSVYIRGGDFDQVAYEFDGLPLTRQSDLAPIATLTSLGNQEVQVYTGGTPATSNSSGLAGYINQVIKTGTYPGFIDGTLGAGSPSFYHSATVEASGATPNRLFSYYVGLAATNQDFRYTDQFNGAGNPLYFYPLVIPTTNGTYNILDGSGGPAPDYGAIFAPGNSYAQATNFDRENIINLHWAIPHKHDSLRDDIQALYVTGGINTQMYSSPNELGANGVATAVGYPVPYLTSDYYTGALMQAPNPNNIVLNSSYPSQPANTTFIGNDQRDGSYNGYSIEKLQYQKNINDHSYLRLLGYSEWSDWFINGPTSAQLTYGAELADYEVKDNTFGAGLTYANQLSPKNLITAQAAYMTQKLQTYNAQFSSTDPNTTSLGSTGLGTVLSNYIDNNGNCYNYTTGQVWSCFDAGSQGGNIGGSINLSPGSAPTGTPAASAGAHWVVTENGYSAQIDNVQPFFTSYSMTDLWQPNDKLTFNIGARFDHFVYNTKDLSNGYPARQFWFNAYNNEHCGTLGLAPVWTFSVDSSGNGSFLPCSTFGPNYAPLTDPGNGLYNTGAAFSIANVFQPRVSGTWTLNPDTVIRASYGKYARAEASSYYQYDTVQQNLPSFISQFYSYGYHTPDHDIYPDTSDNFDLSLEKHIHGTDMSFKLTPFYRGTHNQIQYLAISALGGTLAGLNVGTQQSYGLEFAFQKGDFARNGLAYQLSYTHTTSKIKYAPINGQSVIDSLNAYIEQYNSYTYQCAQNESTKQCGSGQYAANGAASFDNSANTTPGPTNVPNPYYCVTVSAACPYKAQPLLDTNGSYTPYDVIPTPFNAANGYEVPDVISFVMNYRHNRLAITPSLRWNNGSYYGSPVQWPGYVPQACTALPSDTPTTPGVTCGSGGALFLPDPYNGNQFDNLGTFRQPSQLSLNLQTSYDISPRITVTAMALNIIDKCYQRGYAWDNSTTCVYSSLPSNILAPAGNFLTNPPVQLAYPYGTFFNITEVGTSSVVQPFNFYVNVNVKL